MDVPGQNSSPNADHLLSFSVVANSNLPILTAESRSILGDPATDLSDYPYSTT